MFDLDPARLVLLDRAEGPLYDIDRELDLLGGRDSGTPSRGGRARAELVTRLANVASRDTMDRILADLAREGRLLLPVTGTGDEHAWHLFVIRLGEGARPADTVDTELPGVAGLPPALRLTASRRARAIEALREASIGTSVHFIPLHLHPLYARMGYRPGQFPNAEAAYAGAISLPIWPGMTEDQVDRVIAGVKGTLAT